MEQRLFEALVGPFLPDLFRLACSFTGDRHDAEDLLQSVLLKLYPRLEELQAIDSLKHWLAKVLYREFVDTKRRQKRWLKLVENRDCDMLDLDSQAELEAVSSAPDYIYRRKEQQQRLRRALDTLGEEQRLLVILHDVEGYTLQELTGILELPAGTVKSRLHRGRQRLREYLQGEPAIIPERVNQ